MGYERTKFGNDVLTGSGGNVKSKVSNHYGPRDTGKTVGLTYSDGFIRELSIDIDGPTVTAAEFALTVAPILPAGTRIADVFLHVTEAFVASGTTPAIEIGTEGSEVTNGFTITEAQAEGVGIYNLTSALSGTWGAATGLAAATTVGIALSGTSPAVTSAGKARVVIRYVNM